MGSKNERRTYCRNDMSNCNCMLCNNIWRLDYASMRKMPDDPR